MIHKKIEVTGELAGRADRVVQALAGVSRSETRGLFSHDCVSVNGTRCDAIGQRVEPGDVVELRYDAHQRYHERARPWEDDAFKILFEDKHLIVVDKAAGILTVPAHPGDKDTLLEAVSYYFAHSGLRERAQCIHRLDRDVSGVLVLAKSRPVAEALQSQFEARKPEREYVAIVQGAVAAEGTFESHLATTRNLQQYSTHRPGEGQHAITHFRLQKRVHGASWVRVWLETGRRNQIRVHFADAGHPILGDTRYGADISKHPKWRVKRLALHAAVLGFQHPVTGKAVRFESPMPAALKAFVGESRTRSR